FVIGRIHMKRRFRTFLFPALATIALATSAIATTINAVYSGPDDVPLTTATFTASGNSVNIALNYAPTTGTTLTIVKNTGLNFIVGTFDNLQQGQKVSLLYGTTTYDFVANYYGGTGNDLVLQWAAI